MNGFVDGYEIGIDTDVVIVIVVRSDVCFEMIRTGKCAFTQCALEFSLAGM